MFTIYALRDPDTDQIRYVGATKRDPQVRLAQHILEASFDDPCPPRRLLWIRECLEKQKPPTIHILELVFNGNWRSAEKKWIRQLNAKGYNLLNGRAPDAAPRKRNAKEAQMDDNDGSQGYGPGYLIGAAAIGNELGLKERRARYWIQQGIIPAMKVRNFWMIHKADLEARFRTATVPVSAHSF